jgi:hypothetical protein
MTTLTFLDKLRFCGRILFKKKYLESVLNFHSVGYSKMMDQYLDQNARTVVKAIKKDNFQKKIKDAIYRYEKSHKNRKQVLKALK